MKRSLSLVLALIMVISMIPFSAFAAGVQTLVIGENTAVLDGSDEGAVYTWTAEDTGTLTITMPEDAENGWEYSVSNSNATGSVKTYYSDGWDNDLEDYADIVYSQTLDVTKDDVITVKVNTLSDFETLEYSAGTVVFSAMFESGMGSESSPIDLVDNDLTDGAVITTDITVGAAKTMYYQIYKIQNMILTVTGEGDFTVVCGKQSVTAVDGVAQLEGLSVASLYEALQIKVINNRLKDLEGFHKGA